MGEHRQAFEISVDAKTAHGRREARGPRQVEAGVSLPWGGPCAFPRSVRAPVKTGKASGFGGCINSPENHACMGQTQNIEEATVRMYHDEQRQESIRKGEDTGAVG